MYLNSATFSIPWHDILSSSMSWSSMRYCTTVSLSSVILFCSRPVGNTPAASFRSCQMCCRLIALELFWTGEVARSWKMIVESKSSSFCPSTGCSLSPVRVEFLLKTDSGYPKDTGVTLCDWRVFATQERKKKRRGWRCGTDTIKQTQQTKHHKRCRQFLFTDGSAFISRSATLQDSLLGPQWHFWHLI